MSAKKKLSVSSRNHIIYRFRIPDTITINQCSMFTGRKMVAFASEVGFKMLTLIPYYAQANGQVKAANNIVFGLIKKRVGQKPRNWHRTINYVLWACRNSSKESTNCMMFQLVYSHDAILPLEIHLQKVRIQRQIKVLTEYYWGMMLDELSDLDEKRLTALDILIRQKDIVAKA